MPDSDDEEIIDIDDVATKQTSVQAKKRKEESKEEERRGKRKEKRDKNKQVDTVPPKRHPSSPKSLRKLKSMK